MEKKAPQCVRAPTSSKNQGSRPWKGSPGIVVFRLSQPFKAHASVQPLSQETLYFSPYFLFFSYVISSICLKMKESKWHVQQSNTMIYADSFMEQVPCELQINHADFFRLCGKTRLVRSASSRLNVVHVKMMMLQVSLIHNCLY